MEKFVVEKNCWHYKLVKEHVTENYPYELWCTAMPKDFCSYWRRVVIESVKIGVIISVLLVMIITVLFGIGLLLYYAIFDFSGVGLTLLSAIVVISSVILVICLPTFLRVYKINSLRQGNAEIKQTNNIFVQRYKAWKGKFCPVIHYEKD